MFRLFLLFLLCAALTACGNKGDLFLPEKEVGPIAETPSEQKEASPTDTK